MCHPVDCGCGQHAHQVPWRRWHGHRGCCCAPEYAPRCFPSREEIIEGMEEYLKQLRAEAKGVEERIAELRREV